MTNKIIELLSIKKNNNLTIEEISSIIGVNKEDIEKIIMLLEEEGIIFRQKNDKYILTSNTSLRKGIVKIPTRKGKGPIVVFDDNKELNLVYKDISKVKSHDIVLVEPYNQSSTAKIVKILKREYKDYVGEVIKDGKNYKVIAKDRDDITIREKLPIGSIVLVDGKDFTIKEIICHKDDPDKKTKEVLSENKFPISFSDGYLKELESIPTFLSPEIINEEIKKGRIDLRKIPHVTIDGIDTKDFDDAVSIVGDTIYISIIDVPFFIKENSIMFNETLKRGISVYPPGMVNPMINHKLSNGICSIIPKEDRLCLSAAIKIDSYGNITSLNIFESIIESKMRMTYSDVNLFLEDNITLPEYEEYTKMISSLYDKAMIFKRKMLNDGFLEFSSKEVQFFFDNMNISKAKKRHQGKAEELIEFLMLVYNLTMTNESLKHGLPLVMRVHDEPNQEKLSNWNSLLKQRGYNVSKKSKFSKDDIKERLDKYKDAKEKIILDDIAIKSQSKAKYSAYNIGHYALGQEAYATFSSPVRRIDFINQMVYKDYIHYGAKNSIKNWEKKIPLIAKIATDSEKRSTKVERILTDINMAKYMNKFIGEEYTALVSEVGDTYIKVLLPNMCEGYVYINSREYHISKDRFSLISNDSSETILVGDYINVKLVKTDVNTGEIRFLREERRVKGNKKYEEKKTKKKVKIR